MARTSAPPRPRWLLPRRAGGGRARATHLGLLLVRVAGAAAAVAGLATFVVAPLVGRFGGEFEDFDAYLRAGRAVAAGGSPYDDFVHQVPTPALSGFDYPPLVAWLCRPLALLSPGGAVTAWLLLGVACTVAGAVVVARTVLPRSWPRLELATLGAFLFGPALYNYWHGQMNPVVFLLLALALRAWVSGSERSCGALIGLAAGIKLAPAVLVLLLLRRRWWRGAATAAGGGLATLAAGAVLVGGAALRTWVSEVLPVLSRDDGWLYNQSWAGVVDRLAGHSVLTVEPDSALLRCVATALSAATLALAAACVRRRRRWREQRAAEFAAGVLAMLLAGTITWYAHYVHLLIALAAAAALLARVGAGRRRALALGIAAALVSSAVVAPLLIARASMDGIVAVSRTGWWWPLMQVCSLPAAGAAALLAALALTLRREPEPERGAPRAQAAVSHHGGDARPGPAAA